MVKYYSYQLTFLEVPDEVNLCFSITNCQNRCDGCHSSFLREDIGDELTIDVLKEIFKKHDRQFTCVCFLGEGNDYKSIQKLITYSHSCGYKTCLYCGRDYVEKNSYTDLDYIKMGRYIESRGPLNNRNTNQKMYKICDNIYIDITYKFWH